MMILRWREHSNFYSLKAFAMCRNCWILTVSICEFPKSNSLGCYVCEDFLLINNVNGLGKNFLRQPQESCHHKVNE